MTYQQRWTGFFDLLDFDGNNYIDHKDFALVRKVIIHSFTTANALLLISIKSVAGAFGLPENSANVDNLTFTYVE